MQDIEFIGHEPASAADVSAYEQEDGPGPNVDMLAFDLTQNHSSIWNSKVLNILLSEFQAHCEEQDWPVKKSDNYILDVLRIRYKRLRTVWRNAQPKLLTSGSVESPPEVEAQLLDQRLRIAKESQQATRRRNVSHDCDYRIQVLTMYRSQKSHCRKTVLDHTVNLKTADNEDDLPAWQWLQCLVSTLGEGRMSSEESDSENMMESVLWVKNMEWRRCVSAELDIVDRQRVFDADIFAPQGSKPVKRIRASANPLSCRDAVEGLLLALYDPAWLEGLNLHETNRLAISCTDYPWMKFAVARM
jgi:hypothetical protein